MLLLSGCTGLRYVPEDERLYTGHKLRFESGKHVKDSRQLRKELNRLVLPRPNKKVLWARPKLWMYYVAGEPKKNKGFRHWLKNKMGEPPVYMSSVDAPLVTQAIDAKLYNMGFFDSYSHFEKHEQEKKPTAFVTYGLFVNPPYLIDEVVFPKGKDTLDRVIRRSQKRTLLKPGKRYDLELLIAERERIEDYLKNRGFYFFRTDYLLYKMDTSISGRKLRLTLEVKWDAPSKARMVYRLAEVKVFPDYTLGMDTVSKKAELVDSVFYYRQSEYIKARTVTRCIFMKNGRSYSRRRHQITLSRLNGLGVFKFVNVHIHEKDSSSSGELTTDILLSPLPRRTISTELQGVSKSNNFIGPGVTLSLRNRNAFRGAELLIYSIRASCETQLNGLYKGRFTYEVNPKVELQVPRLISPVKFAKNSMYVPRTRIAADYGFLSRVGYFDMNSFKLSFGYKWKSTRMKEHELNPISINYFNIKNTTVDFEGLLNRNVLLRNRFQKQLIAGVSYSYFYNQQVQQSRMNQFYFNGNVELAGNALALYKRLTAGEFPDPSNPLKVLGIKFAQFARFDIDLRDFAHLQKEKKSMIAGRFIAGLGVPYGNSSSLPYIRQFFSGGAYSVRGFQAFSLGPGSYRPPDSVRSYFFLQQGGDIKLEFNAEYRFTITRVLRAAFFTDAGNTWLFRANPSLPGGEFRWNSFMWQFAMGVGTGLRVDLGFFVLRFDLGIPARKPWLPEGQRWVLDDIDMSSKKWRRENLVFNIAFGYPF